MVVGAAAYVASVRGARTYVKLTHEESLPTQLVHLRGAAARFSEPEARKNYWCS